MWQSGGAGSGVAAGADARARSFVAMLLSFFSICSLRPRHERRPEGASEGGLAPNDSSDDFPLVRRWSIRNVVVVPSRHETARVSAPRTDRSSRLLRRLSRYDMSRLNVGLVARAEAAPRRPVEAARTGPPGLEVLVAARMLLRVEGSGVGGGSEVPSLRLRLKLPVLRVSKRVLRLARSCLAAPLGLGLGRGTGAPAGASAAGAQATAFSAVRAEAGDAPVCTPPVNSTISKPSAVLRDGPGSDGPGSLCCCLAFASMMSSTRSSISSASATHHAGTGPGNGSVRSGSYQMICREPDIPILHAAGPCARSCCRP